MEYRTEKDLLGEKQVPAQAYWGIHTQRATENFPLSKSTVNPGLIRAYALVKKACCRTNKELKLLDEKKADAIISACDEILEGKLSDQFPVDALQGGAGTSTNMNVNEVLANRAIELLKGKKGDYSLVHPIQDVNLNQSTNDTYPTALKVSAIYGFRNLSRQIEKLQAAFQKKEKEFAKVVTIARTEMQEAVPVTLGLEFSAAAEALARDRWRTFKCEERLRVVNIGGTAIGTGITAPRSYIFMVAETLRELSGLGLSRGENLLDATTNADCFVEVSGILKAHAANLIKTANDLRILSLTGEIKLSALQAGSSVMPGKVNPVVAEAVIQSATKVIANDGIITDCCLHGSLQINEFLPLLGHALLESLDLLCAAAPVFAAYVEAVSADAEKCREYFEHSPMIITALLPHIGYEKAQALHKEFSESGQKNVRMFLEERLGKELLERVFDPYNLISLGYTQNGAQP